MVKIRSWVAALFSLVLGTTPIPGGPSPSAGPPSIPSRVAAVRSALAERQGSNPSTTLPGTEDTTFHEVAQQPPWGNWLNWGNWGNWNNWNNWGNWGNWRNF
jgi:hypothetical protein